MNYLFQQNLISKRVDVNENKREKKLRKFSKRREPRKCEKENGRMFSWLFSHSFDIKLDSTLKKEEIEKQEEKIGGNLQCMMCPPIKSPR